MKRVVAFTIRGNKLIQRLFFSKFPIVSLTTKTQLYFTPKAFFNSPSSPATFDFTDLIDSFKYEETELQLKKIYLQNGIEAMLQEFELVKSKKAFNIQTYDVVLRQVYLDMRKRHLSTHIKLMENLIEDIYRNKLTLNDSIINSMIAAYQLNGNLEKGLEYLKMLKGMRSTYTYIAYSRIIQTLGTQKKFEEMEGIYREVRKDTKSHRATPYNSMIKVYVRLGETAEVERILKNMQEDHVKFDSYTYELLIDYYAKQGKLEKVNSVASLMRQKGFPMRVETYAILIQAHVANEDITSAFNYLGEMKEARLPLNFRVFTAFMNFFHTKNASKQRAAEELYRHFVPNGGKVIGYGVPEYLLAIFEHIQKSYAPTPVVYTRLIFVAGIHNKLHMALTLFQQCIRAGFPPTTDLCNIILKFLVDHKHLREMDKFVEKMKQSGIPFDSETNAILRKAG